MELEPVNILKDVVAYVEVRSSSDNRSAAVCRALELLGAKVASSFSDDVTHVVYKEGLKRTYAKAQRKGIPLVSVLWLDSCRRNQMKMPEKEFAVLVEEEHENPLIKFKPKRRWKKMKSMQPCEFDEEVAKSAERSAKRRRRVQLANRFKFSDDTTPPGGSPGLVLALDTQARSPFFANNSRFSSPSLPLVPDTPPTPTMKERIEKMRLEHRNLIGARVETPKSSVLETAVLQRRLFERLAKDLFSKEDSSDEDDDGETAARVVAKLIEGLDTRGNSSLPRRKRSPVKRKSTEKSGEVDEVQECSKDRMETDIFSHLVLPKNTHTSQECAVNDERVVMNNGHLANDVFHSQKSTPGSKRKSLGSCKENLKKTGIFMIKENKLSSGSSSDESCILSPVNGNKDPFESAEPGVPNPVAASLESNSSTSKDKNSCRDTTPKSSKVAYKFQSEPVRAKVIKKKKLFSDPIFSTAVLPLQEKDDSSKESPEAPSSNPKTLLSNEKTHTFKAKKGSTEAAEVSFLFQGTSDNNKDKVVAPRRRSKRLSSIAQTNLSPVRRSNAKEMPSADTSRSLSLNNTNTADNTANHLLLKAPRTRHSLGTSMSILYGADSTLLNSSLKHPCRRSIDEFSIKPAKEKASAKKRMEIQNGKQDSQQKKRALDTSDSSDQRLEGKQQQGEQRSEIDDSPQAKKKKKTKSSSDEKDSSRVESKDNSSDASEERLATPCRLRHANSLIMQPANCQKTGKGTLSLVMTSLHRDEQDVVSSVVKKLGVFHTTGNVEATTTHIVSGEPRRTLNLLRAIARGCWVLKKEWVLESLEAGTWLMEENYEMEQEFPAAKESRLKRHDLGKAYRADLFSHLGFICVSGDCSPSRQDLVHLIKLCSGKVTSSNHRASVYLGMEYLPDIIVIKPTWVLDSIMKMTTQDPGDYVIPAPRRREASPEF